MEAGSTTLEYPGYTVTVVRHPEASSTPTDRLEAAESLRRFAEAEVNERMAEVAAWATRDIPRHVESLAESPGMDTSIRVGALRKDLAAHWAVMEVAAALDLASITASMALDRALALVAEYPLMLSALRDGKVGAQHVRVILEQAAQITAPHIPKPERPAPDAPAADQEAWGLAMEQHSRAVKAAQETAAAARTALGESLLASSSGCAPGRLKSKAKTYRQKHHPESFTTRTKKASATRQVRISEADEDGMCYLEAKLSSLAGEAINNRLESIAAVLSRNPDEKRTQDQLHADILTDLVLAGPDASGIHNIKPTVVVTIPSTFFPGTPGGPAAPGRTPGGGCVCGLDPANTTLPPGADVPHVQSLGPIDQESAAVLLSLASTWDRVVTDPLTGAVVAFGRERYRPTPAQRRALGLRDRTCRFPGCRRPAHRCDPDHVIEFQHGGSTDLSNLASACRRHHRFKSLGLYTVELSPEGTFTVTTLGGTVRTTFPDAPWFTGTADTETRHPVVAASDWDALHRMVFTESAKDGQLSEPEPQRARSTGWDDWTGLDDETDGQTGEGSKFLLPLTKATGLTDAALPDLPRPQEPANPGSPEATTEHETWRNDFWETTLETAWDADPFGTDCTVPAFSDDRQRLNEEAMAATLFAQAFDLTFNLAR